MALETATHINDLVITNPDGLDDLSQGDNHIRMVKDVLKRDLPLTTPATALGISLLTSATALAVRLLIGASNTPFRNKIINGDFNVTDHYSANIPVSSSIVYFVNRFYGYSSGAAVSVITYPTLQSFQIFGSTSNTAVNFGTRVLSTNAASLASDNATLSCFLKCNTGTLVVNWSVFRSNGTDTYGTVGAPAKTSVASGTFTATTTKTRFAATIAMPSGVNTGLEILFNIAGLPSGQDLQVSNVQLEKGAILAADVVFEDVDSALQLLRCQQYFSKTTCTARGPATAVNQSFDTPIYLPVKMRAIPTATYNTGTGAAANATTISIFGLTQQSGRFSITSVAAGDCYAVDREYSFDAELYT
jgi:hypothetical protein